MKIKFSKFGPLLAISGAIAMCSCRSNRLSSADYSGPPAQLYGQVASAPSSAPDIVHRAIAAGNSIQHVPYQYGGGHGRPCHGLDCSGTVSYVLRSCGLMRGATTSRGLTDFGNSGAGKWITVYAKNGHAFMTVAGLRLDTSSQGTGQGPRWTTKPRQVGEFDTRHPAGL